jgi:polyisoprenoid-binding protein YceI
MNAIAARTAARTAGAILVLGLLAGAAPGLAQPLTYHLDPAHSWVHFEVLHFGTSTIRGRIGPVRGSVTVDPAAGRGELGLAVPTASVSTGIGVFDARLREDDLLAAKAHPEAWFVATRFVFDGSRVVSLHGEFTWRGVSQPLTLNATRYACRSDTTGPAPVQVCGGDFEGELLRSDFGATFGLPFVANRVRLQVQVEGRRP